MKQHRSGTFIVILGGILEPEGILGVILGGMPRQYLEVILDWGAQTTRELAIIKFSHCIQPVLVTATTSFLPHQKTSIRKEVIAAQKLELSEVRR